MKRSFITRSASFADAIHNLNNELGFTASLDSKGRRQASWAKGFSDAFIRAAADVVERNVEAFKSFGVAIDPTAMRDDLAFAEAFEAPLQAATTLVRQIGDEVMTRRERAANAAVSVVRYLEVAERMSSMPNAAASLQVLQPLMKRPKRAKAKKASKAKAPPKTDAPAKETPAATTPVAPVEAPAVTPADPAVPPGPAHG